MTAGSARSSGAFLAGVAEPEQVDGVLPRRLRDGAGRDTAERRNPIDGLGQVARGVRFTAAALRRQKGGIGLHQHPVEGNDAGGPDYAVRARVGHGGRKGEVEATSQPLGGNRGVPGKTVKDAPHAGKLVEDGEEITERVARMQDDRLVHLLRETQHLAEDLVLRLLIHPMGFRDVVIEADLPDGDHPGIARQLAELPSLGRTDGLSRRMRMAANGCAQPGDPLGELQPWPVVRAIIAHVDHRVDAGLTRLFERLLGRQRRGQMQEVRVRVDQAIGSGFSMRGNRMPPRLVCVRGASLPHSRAAAQGVLKSALTWLAILIAVSGRKGEIR